EVMKRQDADWSEADEQRFYESIVDLYNVQGHPLYASARLWDDGVIDPKTTRQVLAHALRASRNAPVKTSRFGIFRM
ncbi:hypothetical protein AKJ18_34155, partial [Vibrio xuii]